MYAQFFMLSLLSPNGGGLKIIFGVKKEDLLRVWKYLQRGVFLPLGFYRIMSTYRVEKHSFNEQHFIIETPLKEYFLPKVGTQGELSVIPKRDAYKAIYLIKTKFWLSIVIL